MSIKVIMKEAGLCRFESQELVNEFHKLYGSMHGKELLRNLRKDLPSHSIFAKWDIVPTQPLMQAIINCLYQKQYTIFRPLSPIETSSSIRFTVASDSPIYRRLLSALSIMSVEEILTSGLPQPASIQENENK